MSDFKSYLRQNGLAKSTIEHYYILAMEFITFLDRDHTETENCTEKEILSYIRLLQARNTIQETIQIKMFALKHFFNYQIEKGIRDSNPVKNIKIKTHRKQNIYPVLSSQELQDLYHGYDTEKPALRNIKNKILHYYRLCRKRNKAILGILLYQGATTAEIKRIQVQDIDIRKGTIDIRGGKMGKDRTLELKSHQIVDLMEYLYTTRKELLKCQPEETEILFLSTPIRGQNKVETEEPLNIFNKILQELKMQNPKLINLQQIRVSVIVNWLKKYNLRQVQYKAGHRNIYSTESYLKNDAQELQAEIDKYHPLG
ncbi:tyrosine-type recombinase/integrase [Chryseobacterium sp. JV274]|uniref:tyrosine-type recombinase/integrase n=1 Tax=Chryseobacterium sp. JV274 TaxID=1932669 RepID=UPI0015C25589|nr:tyrosine-type recombinase/integrase [Chryseobacterium sp. JV274]CAD0225805.1 conserved protein of unknown function [Chryseobacterium sp. JV274]